MSYPARIDLNIDELKHIWMALRGNHYTLKDSLKSSVHHYEFEANKNRMYGNLRILKKLSEMIDDKEGQHYYLKIYNDLKDGI